nr:hypothetical protein [Nocardiopsis alkaliphila]
MREYTDPAFARHLRAQRRWPVRTEADRLERAGQALDALGICYFEALECCDGCLAEAGGQAHRCRPVVEQDPHWLGLKGARHGRADVHIGPGRRRTLLRVGDPEVGQDRPVVGEHDVLGSPSHCVTPTV